MLLKKKAKRSRLIFDQVAPREEGKRRTEEEDPFALTNIGVMRFVGPDMTAPIRSETLPLKVTKDCGYAQVFTGPSGSVS